mmetsp:Transcript_21607/g.54418  ORF Transcript_21607/g.54418 Transcript_21607/m.54418 type:complete len:233 (+) Transcript_21607:330-1028(+)
MATVGGLHGSGGTDASVELACEEAARGGLQRDGSVAHANEALALLTHADLRLDDDGSAQAVDADAVLTAAEARLQCGGGALLFEVALAVPVHAHLRLDEDGGAQTGDMNACLTTAEHCLQGDRGFAQLQIVRSSNTHALHGLDQTNSAQMTSAAQGQEAADGRLRTHHQLTQMREGLAVDVGTVGTLDHHGGATSMDKGTASLLAAHRSLDANCGGDARCVDPTETAAEVSL